jgi:hypothetical protein
MFSINKETFLALAEVLDALRIVPRFMLFCLSYLVWHVVAWYMTLQDPTTQQAALVTTVTAIIPAIIGLYQSSGRKWGKTPE